MMKTINRIFVSILLVCVIFFTISLSGCLGLLLEPIRKMEAYYDSLPVCGDFIYAIVEDKNGEKTAVLHGFSEEGKKKVGVILPETVDGYKVSLVGDGRWTPPGKTDVIRLYILSEFTFRFPNWIRQERVWKFNVYNNKTPGGLGGSIFFPYGLEDHYYDYYEEEANVSYMYNYEEAPHNGIYWIDDYDGTTIKFIPPYPVREGYIFDGWYSDEECTKLWDFEKDVIPAKEYKEVVRADGTKYESYDYKNNKLYEKWSKAV